ncbi:MAG: hypothetical protein KatS3mg060_2493 [Dehalococcoidia bacterium]|nr:MAG: hypothetical protein KatS3mg060_2493 [Dehalococcoidia bacterium]
MKFAGFWRRFFALLIDSLVLGGVTQFAAAFVGGIIVVERMNRGDLTAVNPAAFGLSTLISALYFILLIGATGRTLGGMLLGLQVLAVDGSAAGYGRAAIRWVAFTILSAIPIVNLLNFLWMLWDEKRQTIHDKIAGTVVVRP